MRGMMWRLKQVHDDDAGIIVGTGTANAHVAVTKNVFAAYVSGITFTFKPVASNTSAATMNANAVGIKAIRKYNVLGADVALTGGEMLIGRPYRLLYDTTANAAAGAFILLNPEQVPGDTQYSPGTLYGLTLSNNVTDPTNDIDIAVGAARNSIDTANIDLLTALTKQLDVAWAVGTNAGGRMSAAAIADTTYHVFVIKRPDTGVVDVGFDVSPTAPTLPTNYTLFRRIGSIIRLGGTILAFVQTGDTFTLKAEVSNRSSTAATAGSVVALTVPLGIAVRPLMRVFQQQATVGQVSTSFADLSALSMPAIGVVFTTAAGEISNAYIPGFFITNTLAQTFIVVTITAGTLTANILLTSGWIDSRGRLS